MEPKIMNKTPIKHDGYELTFYLTTYAADGSTAVICEDEDGMPFATVSLNLGDYGYFTEKDEIFLNHDLPRDFKEMFCDAFCTHSLSSSEKVPFGPFDAKTEKVTIRKEFI